MTVVDNRVVEMQFDNSQFESNVQTSLSTIDKLKQSLNFNDTSKSLEQVNATANNMNFNGLTNSVDALSQRFTMMGVVANQVIRNITDSMMNLASRAFNFLTSGVIQGGINRAMNLENAHFQLQGLLKDENAVSAVMKNVQDAVDGTAYGLDSAAKVASQLAASGMTAGDDMLKTLRGIAGVAAMTNSSYDDIGNIYTKIAGQGRIMSNDLLSLASRGMNAAAILAESMGKTEAEIRDMVSEGEISFQEFANVMDDTFGEHAKKANETFTGSMANVKSALARIGAEFVSPLIEQNGPLVKFFNILRERINDVKTNIIPFAEMFVNAVTDISSAATTFLTDLDLTNYFKVFYNVVESLKNVFKGLWSVMKPIGQAFLDIFPISSISSGIIGFTEKLKELTSGFKLSEKAAERLRSTFRGVFSILGGVVDVVVAAVNGLVSLFGGRLDLGEIFFSLTSSIEQFGTTFRDTLGGFIDKISATGPSITKIVDTISNAFKNAGEAISNFLNGNGVIEGSVLVLLVYWLRRAGIVFHNFYKSITAGTLGFAGINHGLTQLTDTLFAMEQKLQYDGLLKIAIALAVLAASLLLLSTIDEEDLAKGLAAVAVMWVMMSATLKSMMTMLTTFAATAGKFPGLLAGLSMMGIIAELANAIVKLAISVLILSYAVKNMADLDWAGLFKGLIGVGVLLLELGIFVKAMDETKLRNSVFGIIMLATGLLILTQSVKQLGALDLASLAKGLLGVAALFGILWAFSKYSTGAKGMIGMGAALIMIGAALKIFASAVGDFAGMDVKSLAKGLLSIGAALAIVAGTMRLMPASMVGTAVGLVLVGSALKSIAKAMTTISGIDRGGIVKSLVAIAVVLFELAVALRFMTGTLSGSAALLVASIALGSLVPTMLLLGALSWESIVKGLVALGGAFAVIGIAGSLLGPLIPTMLGLAGVFVLIGVGTLALGAGLTMVGAGLTTIAAGLAAFGASVVANASALVGAVTVILTGIIDLIPTLAEHIAKGLVTIVETVADSAPALADALLRLLSSMLSSVSTYLPQIVSSLAKIICGIFDSLGEHIPEIVQSFLNFLGKLFQGIVDAFNSIDTASLLQGVLTVGIMTALVYAFSGLVGLIPSAMVGVLGLGVIIAELSLVLAALGGLAQIPGLGWLVSEGGNFLQAVGTAIGQFIGGIAGGIAKGATSSLPDVGTNLSDFMTNLQPFISGAKSLDPSMLEGVKALAEVILMLTAADILDGLASFMGGGDSLADFAEQLVPFGEGMQKYGAAVASINTSAIVASAMAAKALVSVAKAIPAEGGFWQLISGKKDLASFGTKLVPFGMGMRSYAIAVAGINTSAIVASASAAKSLVAVANSIPPEGGFWQLLKGEKNLASFGTKLVPFAMGMRAYGLAVVGIDAAAIKASASAAKAIVSVAEAIPPEGGFWQLLKGEKNLASFGTKLVPFGMGMKMYAMAVAGIDFTSIKGSVKAAQGLVEVANAIPPEGGFWQLLSGKKDLAKFGEKFVPFGHGLVAYSMAIMGVNSAAITASVSAARGLISVANAIPTEGGFWSLIDGKKDLASFGAKLVPFGMGMRAYAMAVAGINPAPITASVPAALGLVSVANAIPAEGGFWSIIDGEKDLASFGSKLVPFGMGMKMYAMAVAGIDAAAVTASIPAAKGLVQVANSIPAEGGFWSLVEGEKDLASFGAKLAPFGMGMKMYAMAVAGIDSATIIASVQAALGLVKVANSIPTEGGFWSLVEGEKDLASFGKKMVPFGESLTKYSKAVAGADTASAVASLPAAKAMVSVAKAIPEDLAVDAGSESISTFGTRMVAFGTSLKAYSSSVAGLDADSITASAKAGKSVVSFIKSISGVDTGGVDSFVTAINTLGTAKVKEFVNAFKGAAGQMSAAGADLIRGLVTGINSSRGLLISTVTPIVNYMVKAFSDKKTMFTNLGKTLMDNFINGFKQNTSKIKTAVTSAINSAASAIRAYYGSFYNAGTYLVSGFSSGIAAATQRAANQAATMASKAITAAKKQLGIASPSKVFYGIGEFAGIGFVNALADYSDKAYTAGSAMASSAKNGLSNSISKISDVINSDMDTQPTIRPVLDLSDVESGAGLISNMFGMTPSMAVLDNVGSINASMNRRIQNGANSDVVSAIDKLRKDVGNLENKSYSIGGITYGNDSAVANAIETLVRAVRVEGRV